MRNQVTALAQDRPSVGAEVRVGEHPLSGMAPGALAAVVEGLTYGELQVALYAADIPSKGYVKLSAAEVAKLAAQGLERLGYERVRELDALHSEINCSRVRKL